MADHFYSTAGGAGAFLVSPLSAVTVATSTQAANPLEFRVTDDAVTREQIREFLERLADYFTVNPVAGTTTG